MAKRIVIALVIGVAVAGVWVGSGGLSGRGFGFGDEGCQLTSGRGDDGVLVARARCEWPVAADRLDRLLEAWGHQAEYFRNVAQSTVLGHEGKRTLVRQVYRASGISDRGVVMECSTKPIPGGWRFRWRKAPNQRNGTGQYIEVAVHEGFWQVTGDAHHSVVEYYMRYLPGGSVPSFLVSMFLSSGVRGVLSDLRRAAESSQVAARDAGK